MLPRERLIRFVLDPDGVVTPDFAARLPGRGAWLETRRKSVEAAAAKGLFSRAFRKPARLPDKESAQSFADRIEVGLKRRALDAVGLARRQGALVAGFEKTMAALRSGKAAALIVAADGSEDSAAKMLRAAGGTAVVRDFTAEELSAATGLDRVVFAAAKTGAAAQRIVQEAARLQAYRTGAVCGPDDRAAGVIGATA